jgi:integration host factor subunit beta
MIHKSSYKPMVNQSKLIQQLSKKANIPRGKARSVIDKVFDVMADALAKEERITIRDFGSFTLKKYKNYEYTDPETNKKEALKFVTLPFFKCGKELKERANSYSFALLSKELNKEIKKIKNILINIIDEIEQEYVEALGNFFDTLKSAELLINNKYDNTVQKEEAIAEVKTNFKNYRDKFEHLTRSNLKLVFVGYHNAGKSSLLNALIGEKDFFPTGPVPTTKEIYAEDWKNLVLVDTPGIDSMEKKDEELARHTIKSADIAVFVTTSESELDRIEIDFLRDIIKNNKKILLVVNKRDRVSRKVEKNIVAKIEKQLEEHIGIKEIFIIPVSAKNFLEASDTQKIKESNIHRLKNQITDSLKKDGIANLRTANLVFFINSIIDQSIKEITERSSKTGKDLKTASKDEVRKSFNKANDAITEFINYIDKHFSSKLECAKKLDEKYGKSMIWQFLKGILIVPTLYDWLNSDNILDERIKAFTEMLDLDRLSSDLEKKFSEIEELFVVIDNYVIHSEKIDKIVEDATKQFENGFVIDNLFTADEQKVFVSAYNTKKMFQKWLTILKNATKRHLRKTSGNFFSDTEKTLLELIDQFDNKAKEAKKLLNDFHNYLESKKI